MVTAHDADADYAYFQRTTRTNPASLTHDPKGSLDSVTHSLSPSMAQADWRPNPSRSLNTFYFRYLRAQSAPELPVSGDAQGNFSARAVPAAPRPRLPDNVSGGL
jgi:hypothetical protein